MKDEMRNLILIALVFAACATTAYAQQSSRLRGTIVAVDGNVITVNALGTNTKVTLTEPLRVSLVIKADISKIVSGTFIGTAALPQPDGTLRAQEVTIFPEDRKGVTREGFGPYDLTPQSTMTNAMVSTVDVDRVDGRTLLLKYPDGEKRLVIPANAPIVTFVPGDKTAIVVGAHVILTAAKNADGSFSAGSVSVGKDGLVPPM
jgi:hypothetical protein